MLWIRPASSVFDITTYLLMYFVICHVFIGGELLFSQIINPAIQHDTHAEDSFYRIWRIHWFPALAVRILLLVFFEGSALFQKGADCGIVRHGLNPV